MKKTLSALLTVAMILALTACSSGDSGADTETTAAATSGTAAEETSLASAEEETSAGTASESTVEWPTETITLNCYGAAGGSTDLTARVFAEYLSKETGVAVVVTNDDALIQSQNTHDADPDGYTLGVGAMGFMIYGYTGTLDYGLDGFEPLGIVSEDDTFGLYVTSDAPYQTLEELVAYMQENPGEVNFGVKTATSVHLEAVGFLSTVGCEANVVDAGADAARVTALLGNQIDITIEPYATMKGYLEDGEVVCLGTFQEESSQMCPDIPTVMSQGYDYTFPTNFQALVMPQGASDELVEAISTAVENVVSNPEYIAAINDLGALVNERTYEEAVKYLQEADETISVLVESIK